MSGGSPTTSESSRARVRAGWAARARRPPLSRSRCLRTVLSWRMSAPARSRASVVARIGVQRNAVGRQGHEGGAAAGDECKIGGRPRGGRWRAPGWRGRRRAVRPWGQGDHPGRRGAGREAEEGRRPWHLEVSALAVCRDDDDPLAQSISEGADGSACHPGGRLAEGGEGGRVRTAPRAPRRAAPANRAPAVPARRRRSPPGGRRGRPRGGSSHPAGAIGSMGSTAPIIPRSGAGTPPSRRPRG